MLIVLASAKGGTSKTTIALHLARYLSQRKKGRRVTLHDADRNQSAANWYRRGSGHGVTLADIDEALDPESFDDLVIDSAADPGDDDLAELMEVSDLLVIPSGLGIVDLETTIATADRLALPPDKYTVLLTMVDPRGTSGAMTARSAVVEAGIPCLDRWTYRRNIYSEAALQGTTVDRLKGKPAQQAWGDCSQVFDALLKGRG
jgi:chromosome partitioning protein